MFWDRWLKANAKHPLQGDVEPLKHSTLLCKEDTNTTTDNPLPHQEITNSSLALMFPIPTNFPPTKNISNTPNVVELF